MKQRPYIVTCIGDSSPNGNCLGGIPVSPNCSPNTKLIYTRDSSYTASDGITYKLFGTINGEKRADYHLYLPKNISPAIYEEELLKTYPVLVSMAMNSINPQDVKDFKTFYNLSGYHSMTASGLRSGDIVSMFDKNYSQKDVLWSLPLSKVKREELKNEVANGALSQADCIIISIGANEVFGGPLSEITLNPHTAQKGKLKMLLKLCKEGIDVFKKNLPVIIDEIRKINSNCTIVLAGCYNPIYNYSINDLFKLFGRNIGILGHLIKAGNLLNIPFGKMNKTMKTVAEQYSNIFYVDTNGISVFTDKILEGKINEVPVAASEYVIPSTVKAGRISENPLFNSPHPTKEGHLQIAERILKVLRGTFKTPLQNKNG